MAYIDLLRKYNDKPVVGQGGGWLENFINSWKTVFNPPKVSSAPAVQQAVQKNPQLVQTKQGSVGPSGISTTYRPPTNTSGTSNYYNAPTTNTTSGVSAPSGFTSPLQLSGVKVSLPGVNSPAQLSYLNKYSDPLFSEPSPVLNDLKNIGSGKLLPTLGGILGTVGTLGTNAIKSTVFPYKLAQAVTGKENPFEFHVSEALAGENTMKPVKTTTGSVPGSYGSSLAQKNNTVNRGTTPGPTVDTNALNTQMKGSADAANAANKGDEALFALINDEINNVANDSALLKYAQENGWTQEQLDNETYNRQKKILEDKYGVLGQEADQMIVDAKAQAEKQIADEERAAADYQRKNQAQQEEQKVYADELLKKSQMAGVADEQKLRNVFSNLGTAESSAFINKLMGYTGERAAERTGITRDAQKLIDELGMKAVDEAAKSAGNVKSYRDTLASTIANIGRYKQTLGTQSADELSTLLSNLGQALMEGRGKLFDVQSTIAQNAANRAAANKSTIANYGLNKAFYEDQIDAQNAANLKGKQDTIIGGKYVRPRGFSADLWSMASQLYNGGNLRGQQLVKQLRAAGIPDAQEWMYNYLLNPA